MWEPSWFFSPTEIFQQAHALSHLEQIHLMFQRARVQSERRKSFAHFRAANSRESKSTISRHQSTNGHGRREIFLFARRMLNRSGCLWKANSIRRYSIARFAFLPLRERRLQARQYYRWWYSQVVHTDFLRLAPSKSGYSQFCLTRHRKGNERRQDNLLRLIHRKAPSPLFFHSRPSQGVWRRVVLLPTRLRRRRANSRDSFRQERPR